MIKILVLTDILVLGINGYNRYIDRYFTNISMNFMHFIDISDILMDMQYIGRSRYRIYLGYIGYFNPCLKGRKEMRWCHGKQVEWKGGI